MQSAEKSLQKNPRLLIILNRFVIGGQAVDTIPLAWHLKNEFDILILYGEKEKDEVEPDFLLRKYPGLRLQKMKHLRRSINPFTDLWAFFGVLYNIRKFKADIVHTHGAKSGFIGRLSAWLCGVPVIIHTFHGHLFHSYFSKKISGFIAMTERLMGKITTTAIALSEAQKKELTEEFKILPAAKMRIIQLGFAFDEAADATVPRDIFRSKYQLQPEDVAIGIVGRIVPVKNHSFFVSVIHLLLSEPSQKQLAFFIIGDGDLRARIEKELEARGISYNDNSVSATNRVVFTSWLTDMKEVMNGLDIVTLTSLNEGTPLSIIEAEFFKRPVVATDAGGVKDTMKDGVTGFLTDKTDVTTFCKKLRLLVENEELRRTMGAGGYAFASEKFSKQKEVALTRALYFNLLLQKAP